MVVEASELRRVVERLTGSDDPGPWRCDELYDTVASASLGIWRIHSDRWSVVLKLIGQGGAAGHPQWLAGAEPGHWYYWRREALAYQSGLLSSFTGGLGAPVCHLIAERPDGSVALWLEDLGATSTGPTWSLSRYALSARHLGRAQGEFAVDRPLPRHPWLSGDWLRSYLEQRDGDIALLEEPAAWTTSLARRHVPEDLAPVLLQMRGDQELFLGALDRMPRTVCHLDLHPANLFGTDDRTLLIDWAFMGIGALGEDVGNLVPDAVLDFHVGPERIDDLYQVIFTGYVAGLRDVGWNGSEETIDLAMSATIAAKYAWIAPAMLRAAVDRRPSMNRRPIEETFLSWAPVVPFLISRAERARRLIGPSPGS